MEIFGQTLLGAMPAISLVGSEEAGWRMQAASICNGNFPLESEGLSGQIQPASR